MTNRCSAAVRYRAIGWARSSSSIAAVIGSRKRPAALRSMQPPTRSLILSSEDAYMAVNPPRELPAIPLRITSLTKSTT